MPEETSLTRVKSVTRIKYKEKYKDQFVTLSKGHNLILEDLEIKLDLDSNDDAADTKNLISSE